MLIGIDMLGVQSPEGGDREAGRYGRQLVAALLARDPAHRYVLYTHEGLPTARVPSSRTSLRVSLGPVPTATSARLRPTIQRLLDRNPDRLDWMILLDPFEANYGGCPPESPLGGVRIASIVHDLAPVLADERCLVPLRRHDAILAVSGPTAAECRKRLGPAAARVATIGVACDSSFAAPGPSEPLSKVSGDELGRLGITGPFLLASVSGGAERANLAGILDAYRRLPVEHRRRQLLVVAGRVEDPAAVRRALHDRGCAEGLVLVGEVSEASLRTLFGRCSAFLSPSIEEGSGQALVEAMRSGAPVLAGNLGAQAEIVGDGGLLVDPADPAEIASTLSALLGDADLDREVRKRAVARSSRFTWEPVVSAVVEALSGSAGPGPGTKPKIRFDRAHVARPRIAIFPEVRRDPTARVDLSAQVPQGWRETYNVDLYLAPSFAALADGLPVEFGGFDDRLFDRNDSLLGYHAVAYRIGDLLGDFDATLARLKNRPGLVLLRDDAFLDAIAPEPVLPAPPVRASRPATPPKAPDARADRALARLREVFATGSRVAVESPRHFDRIVAALPEFAAQLAEIPPSSPPVEPPARARMKARAALDLLPGSILIGQLGRRGDRSPPLTPRAFRALRKAVPEAVLLNFDPEGADPRAAREARKLGLGASYLQGGPIAPGKAASAVAMLDIAIHAGGHGPIALLDLLRAGVPTIAIDADLPAEIARGLPAGAEPIAIARAVRDLAIDPAAMADLGRSARAYLLGTPDPERASALLVDQFERCAAELPRIPGRQGRRPADRPKGLTFSPHFPRPASATDEAATRSR